MSIRIEIECLETLARAGSARTYTRKWLVQPDDPQLLAEGSRPERRLQDTAGPECVMRASRSVRAVIFPLLPDLTGQSRFGDGLAEPGLGNRTCDRLSDGYSRSGATDMLIQIIGWVSLKVEFSLPTPTTRQRFSLESDRQCNGSYSSSALPRR